MTLMFALGIIVQGRVWQFSRFGESTTREIVLLARSIIRNIFIRNHVLHSFIMKHVLPSDHRPHYYRENRHYYYYYD